MSKRLVLRGEFLSQERNGVVLMESTHEDDQTNKQVSNLVFYAQLDDQTNKQVSNLVFYAQLDGQTNKQVSTWCFTPS